MKQYRLPPANSTYCPDQTVLLARRIRATAPAEESVADRSAAYPLGDSITEPRQHREAFVDPGEVVCERGAGDRTGGRFRGAVETAGQWTHLCDGQSEILQQLDLTHPSDLVRLEGPTAAGLARDRE